MSYQILTVGNPNSGKTTLFNGLTGARQKVGNWAGVTVEKKTGKYNHDSDEFLLTDLPGIYSLDSDSEGNSLDESIASQAIINHPADVIINVIDASCLERSLYMTLQLRELGRPMVVVLNKMDLLKRQRQIIDVKSLEQQLGCPVLTLSANNKKDVAQFKNALHQLLDNGFSVEPMIMAYGNELEEAIEQLTPLFKQELITSRAYAIRLVEGDTLVTGLLSGQDSKLSEQVCQQLASKLDADMQVADVRYTYLYELCKQVRRQEGKFSRSLSDKIDQVLLHKWVGIPFFFLVMYMMFLFSIRIGGAFIDFFDISMGTILVDGGHHLLDGHLPVWLVTILADGIGGGIQTVATFIPVIACLYLFLAVLESSGYMARAAFVLDKVMQKVGLPGKAFMPLILGFGCNVPSIMATRTLEQERERKLTAAMIPFMSCGARLPVYALFAAAFFPENGQNIVFGLYLLGIFAAMFTGIILRHTLYPGNSSSLVMEMPDYELPTMRNVMITTWQKLNRFVLGAGKTIVIVVTLLSFFNSLGTDGSFGNENTDKSLLSKAAMVITPIFKPIGIQQENWPATVGIITGIFAKEAVVGTLNSLYAPSEDDAGEYDLVSGLTEAVESIPANLLDIDLADPAGIRVGSVDDLATAAEEQEVSASIFGNIQAQFVTSAAAFAYLVFILLYTPCVAAVGTYVKEFGKKYAAFISSWTMLLAIVISTVVYQVGEFNKTPGNSSLWIMGSIVLLFVCYLMLKWQGKQQQQLITVQAL